MASSSTSKVISAKDQKNPSHVPVQGSKESQWKRHLKSPVVEAQPSVTFGASLNRREHHRLKEESGEAVLSTTVSKARAFETIPITMANDDIQTGTGPKVDTKSESR